MAEQKAIRWGDSIALKLPLEWRKEHNIAVGTKIRVLENADGSLLVLPPECGSDGN